MSCWVVPSIAAEFWNVSLAHVLECAQNGTVRSKMEMGFMLIDVMPDSPTFVRPTERLIAPIKPRTFTEVAHVVEEATDAAYEAAREEEERIEQIWSDEEEPGRPDFALWRQKRRETGRIRRSPRMAA